MARLWMARAAGSASTIVAAAACSANPGGGAATRFDAAGRDACRSQAELMAEAARHRSRPYDNGSSSQIFGAAVGALASAKIERARAYRRCLRAIGGRPDDRQRSRPAAGA